MPIIGTSLLWRMVASSRQTQICVEPWGLFAVVKECFAVVNSLIRHGEGFLRSSETRKVPLTHCTSQIFFLIVLTHFLHIQIATLFIIKTPRSTFVFQSSPRTRFHQFQNVCGCLLDFSRYLKYLTHTSNIPRILKKKGYPRQWRQKLVAYRKCTGHTSNKMVFNYEPRLFPRGICGFYED